MANTSVAPSTRPVRRFSPLTEPANQPEAGAGGFGDPKVIENIATARSAVPGPTNFSLNPPVPTNAPPPDLPAKVFLPPNNDDTMPLTHPASPAVAGPGFGQFQQDINSTRTDAQKFRDLLNTREQIAAQQKMTPQQAGTAPSLGRRFLAGAAGAGLGFLSMNPLVGLASYKAITGMPEAERQGRLAQQASAYKEELPAAQGAADVDKTLQQYSEEPAKMAAIEVQKRQLTQPHLQNYKTAGGQEGVASVDKDTGQIQGQQVIPGSGTYNAPEMTGVAGTIGGKSVEASLDHRTGKVMYQGQDVSSVFQPAEKDSGSPLDQAIKAWMLQPENKGASYMEGYKELAPYSANKVAENTFNRNNPGADEDNVKKIADQVENDPTGTLINKLVGTDKKLRHQVTNELMARDADIRVLNPSTRQLGESAHAIIPKIDDTIKILNDPKIINAMGPLGSRWQDFIAGKVGSSDPLWRNLDPETIQKINRLRVTIGLTQTGVARAHIGARGSEGLQAKFAALFNTDKMDAKTLQDSLQATRDFLSTYEKAVYKNKTDSNPAPAPGAGGHPLDQFWK